jgi:hypothetical protein
MKTKAMELQFWTFGKHGIQGEICEYFQMERKMHHNFIGNYVFHSQHLIVVKFIIHVQKVVTEVFCDSIKEDLYLKIALFEGSIKECVDTGKEKELNKGEDSEKQEDKDGQKDTDSRTQKEPITYKHKYGYYSSSVRYLHNMYKVPSPQFNERSARNRLIHKLQVSFLCQQLI